MKKTELDTPNNRQQWEVADIFHLYGDHYRQSNSLPYEKIKVMHHIEVCRTAKLAGKRQSHKK